MSRFVLLLIWAGMGGVILAAVASAWRDRA
jgi:hypothetical protein